MSLKPGSKAHGVPTSGGESAGEVDFDRPLYQASLPEEDAGHEAAWAAEIYRRVEDLRSGKVKPIPGEQVFDELEDLLR